MSTKQRVRLYPVKFFPATDDLEKHAYAPDARGGFRPVDPAHIGTISLACPYADCGAPLVWDVSASYLSVSRFQCDTGHRKSISDPDRKGVVQI